MPEFVELDDEDNTLDYTRLDYLELSWLAYIEG